MIFHVCFKDLQIISSVFNLIRVLKYFKEFQESFHFHGILKELEMIDNGFENHLDLDLFRIFHISKLKRSWAM